MTIKRTKNKEQQHLIRHIHSNRLQKDKREGRIIIIID